MGFSSCSDHLNAHLPSLPGLAPAPLPSCSPSRTRCSANSAAPQACHPLCCSLALPPPTPLRLPPSKLPPGRSMDAGGPAWRRGCAESAESLNAAGRLCSSRNEQPPPPQQRARGSGAPRVSRPSPLRSPIVLSSSYGGNVRTLPPSSHGASNLETLSSLWGRESRRMRGGKTKRPPSPESPKQMAISCTLAPL